MSDTIVMSIDDGSLRGCQHLGRSGYIIPGVPFVVACAAWPMAGHGASADERVLHMDRNNP
jgi:hypothetical protein